MRRIPNARIVGFCVILLLDYAWCLYFAEIYQLIFHNASDHVFSLNLSLRLCEFMLHCYPQLEEDIIITGDLMKFNNN